MTGTHLSEAIWDLVSYLTNAAGTYSLTYGSMMRLRAHRWGIRCWVLGGEETTGSSLVIANL
jgi:hypothetical protein